MFEITLPLPPSVNESYAVVRRRKILTLKARCWMRDSLLQYKSGVNWATYEPPILMHRSKVRTNVNFTFPDNRRRDQSNYIKQLYDFLVKARILHDDSQIVEEHIYSKVDKGKREVHIKIEEIE